MSPLSLVVRLAVEVYIKIHPVGLAVKLEFF